MNAMRLLSSTSQILIAWIGTRLEFPWLADWLAGVGTKGGRERKEKGGEGGGVMLVHENEIWAKRMDGWMD